MSDLRSGSGDPAPPAGHERGRLKVFLGAAPGVGKTYKMLSDGADRRRTGVDVVIAIAETHGSRETEAIARRVETVPRRSLEEDGRSFTEMDLDAVLARAPDLALVDDLAHRNAPGSRHPKRYQDVDELLDAGIDVYATLNIQHVESLNDIVASFTRVRVAETVPDGVLDAAEIEMVDLPPDELIERLKAGKVHVPEEATRALNHYFSKSSLSALRELALRRAAQAVDAQMLDYVRSHALAGTWAGGERIVVAVSELPGADGLVRAAKRIADAQHAPLTAVNVETPRTRGFTDEDRRRLAATMNLATQLGATVVTVPATSVVEGLKAYTVEARATQLVCGKSARSRLFELRHGSVVDRLVRETPGVAVHVLPLDEAQPPPKARAKPRGSWGRRSDYLWATALVVAITGVAIGLYDILNLGNIALLYLLPVMVIASLYGLRAGLYTGIASSLAYNFFFLPPTGTLTISNPENVITILVLLGVAFVTSQFAARVRLQADMAASSARANAALAGFLGQLTATANEEELAQAICAEIARLFDVNTVFLAPGQDEPVLIAAYPPEDRLDTIERAAVSWVLERGAPAGRGSDTLTASDWLFHPLRSGHGTLAAVGLARPDGHDPISSDRLPLLMSLLDQAALALERTRLEAEMRGLAQLRERDRLRAALLSSVSHDLRTPLTAILAATTELRRRPDDIRLIEGIEAEAQRLNRFVANLLDMARVEAGALMLHAEPVDLTDAIAAAVHDTRSALDGHDIRLDVAPDLPLVRTDPKLLHHCLINLLDNAGRYANPGTPVTIEARRRPDELILSVIDEGPGLPQGREGEVFETFRRLEGSDRAKAGTGLGLAIVKGFAEAMGLGVTAANRQDRTGASFGLRFPEELLVWGQEQEVER